MSDAVFVWTFGDVLGAAMLALVLLIALSVGAVHVSRWFLCRLFGHRWRHVRAMDALSATIRTYTRECTRCREKR